MPQTVDVLIDQRGLCIEELADQTGMTAERILAIVDGRWTPSPEERRRIAAALGVAVESVSWGHTVNPRNVRYHRYGLREDFSAEAAPANPDENGESPPT